MITDKEAIKAIKTIKDYCKAHNCDNCGMENTCDHFVSERMPPCDWQIVDYIAAEAALKESEE